MINSLPWMTIVLAGTFISQSSLGAPLAYSYKGRAIEAGSFAYVLADRHYPQRGCYGLVKEILDNDQLLMSFDDCSRSSGYQVLKAVDVAAQIPQVIAVAPALAPGKAEEIMIATNSRVRLRLNDRPEIAQAEYIFENGEIAVIRSSGETYIGLLGDEITPVPLHLWTQGGGALAAREVDASGNIVHRGTDVLDLGKGGHHFNWGGEVTTVSLETGTVDVEFRNGIDPAETETLDPMDLAAAVPSLALPEGARICGGSRPTHLAYRMKKRVVSGPVEDVFEGGKVHLHFGGQTDYLIFDVTQDLGRYDVLIPGDCPTP